MTFQSSLPMASGLCPWNLLVLKLWAWVLAPWTPLLLLDHPSYSLNRHSYTELHGLYCPPLHLVTDIPTHKQKGRWQLYLSHSSGGHHSLWFPFLQHLPLLLTTVFPLLSKNTLPWLKITESNILQPSGLKVASFLVQSVTFLILLLHSWTLDVFFPPSSKSFCRF